MTPGLIIAVVAIVLALGFGTFRALTDGRFRGTRRVPGASPASRASRASDGTSGDTPTTPDTTSEARASEVVPVLGTGLGERATLVQFSSAFCAPCRTTRRVLAEVADKTPGVVHVELDAEQHLDLVRTLDVLRTPTTLILDHAGREVARAAGAPRTDQVLQALPAREDPAL